MQRREVKKGLYYDGHKRPDVVEQRTKYLSMMFEEILPCVLFLCSIQSRLLDFATPFLILNEL